METILIQFLGESPRQRVLCAEMGDLNEWMQFLTCCLPLMLTDYIHPAGWSVHFISFSWRKTLGLTAGHFLGEDYFDWHDKTGAHRQMILISLTDWIYNYIGKQCNFPLIYLQRTNEMNVFFLRRPISNSIPFLRIKFYHETRGHFHFHRK